MTIAVWPEEGRPVPGEVDSIFGRGVSGWDVEQWCFDLIKRWISTYLSEVERQHGLEARSLQRPRSLVPTISFDAWPEDQLPRVMLISTGLAGPPFREGDGTYRARWSMSLGVVCSGRRQSEARRNFHFTMLACRWLFGQRGSIDGKANGTNWLIESYAQMPYDNSRSLAGGVAGFWVEVSDVMDASAGPLTPDQPSDDRWPPWQRVKSVWIKVNNVPIDQELPGDIDYGRVLDDEQALATHDYEGSET